MVELYKEDCVPLPTFLSAGAFPSERPGNEILFLNCDDLSKCAVQSKQLKQSDARQGEDGDDDGDDDDNDSDVDDDDDIDVRQSYDYKHGGRCNPLLAGARPVPARCPPGARPVPARCPPGARPVPAHCSLICGFPLRFLSLSFSVPFAFLQRPLS